MPIAIHSHEVHVPLPLSQRASLRAPVPQPLRQSLAACDQDTTSSKLAQRLRVDRHPVVQHSS